MTALSSPSLPRTGRFTAPPAVVALNALQSAVQALVGALPAADASAKTAPVLGHELVRCFADHLELVASDLDTVAGVRVRRDNAERPPLGGGPLWTQLVPGKLLHDLLGRMDAGAEEPATLQPTAPEVLKVATRDGTASLVGADPLGYPLASPFDEPPEGGSRFDVAPGILGTLIDQTVAAASGERHLDHPLMSNLRLWAPEWAESGESGNGLYLEAGDGYRLANAGYAMLWSAHHDPRLEQGVLVPAKALRLVRGLLRREPADAERAAVGLQLLPTKPDAAPNLLEVTLPAGHDGVDALVLRSRLAQGKYPDWSQYYRRTTDIRAVVDAGALLYHVRQCALFAPNSGGTRGADYAPLSLTLDPKAPKDVALRLASKSVDGEHRAWIPAEVTAKGLVSKPVTAGLSVGFLQSVLSTAPGKQLQIGLEMGLLPAHFTRPDVHPADEGGEYHAILMPMGGPHVATDPGPPPDLEGEGESGLVEQGESGLVDPQVKA